MNYKCIDPKIRDVIKALHKNGIETCACCAGVGVSKTYSGRTFAKVHPNRITKKGLGTAYIYAYDSPKSRELARNLEMIKIPPYKGQISYGDESFFEIAREQNKNGQTMIDIRFPYVVFLPIFHPETFKNIDIRNYQKYIYRIKLKWINELYKQIEEMGE